MPRRGFLGIDACSGWAFSRVSLCPPVHVAFLRTRLRQGERHRCAATTQRSTYCVAVLLMLKYMRALRCRRQRERHCLPPRFPVQRGWVCEDMGGGRRFRRERSRGSGAVCVRAPCIINARGFTAAPSTECKHRFGRGYILADRCVRLLSQNGYGNSRQARALNVALVYFAQKFRNPVIWNMETERISLRLFVCFFYWEYTSSRTFYGYLYRLRTEENKTLML